jgi:hypothetical protein
MKTVKINGQRFRVKYLTSSEMRTTASYKGQLFSEGLSCDVYNVSDGKHVALILTSINRDILSSTTIISAAEYAEILELYDIYHAGRYHTACLEKCGAENHLQLY